MKNPWEQINFSDYEAHMSLDSVKQLQSLNQTMKEQFADFDAKSVVILGVAGGNGLEHVDVDKYNKVYGVDINKDYLETVSKRYVNLSGILECLLMDIVHEADLLPEADLLIANLLIEYVGYDAFQKAVEYVNPKYVSCVIQLNTSETEWVSDSEYLHVFDGLDSIHCPMEEKTLSESMMEIGYRFICKKSDFLPNGKILLRLDYIYEK
ncbi:MAG: methyltransferase type 11 [Bacillota bacterium]|nr:methyltransferase type 11 [Bacillota bacterium]